MNDTELGYLPATTLAPMIRRKEISPVEATAAILRRIERLEPKLNAMAHLDAERAMSKARDAEAALMRDGPVGRLHGLTVTIKDLAWTKDFPTESGSHINQGFRPPYDPPIVTRLQDAGAIVLGKTTTSEFGWTGVSRCPLTGITHNPWKHGYNAGASSAGAGPRRQPGSGRCTRAATAPGPSGCPAISAVSSA